MGRARQRTAARAAFLYLGGFLLLLAAGCKSATVGEPLSAEHAKNDPQAQIDFWHALPDRRAVSNDEAFHALLLFTDGEDAAADYPARVGLLRQRKMLPAAFDEGPEQALRRGTLAVALVRALAVPGGLTTSVFGNHARYAVRELEYAGLYPPSSPQQTFSGAELLGIIGRAEDYQRGAGESAEIPVTAGTLKRAGDVRRERAASGSPSSAAGTAGGPGSQGSPANGGL